MSNTKSNEELMLETKNGKTESFEELVKRHQDWAWSVAYRFLGDAPRAENMVQGVFLKIYEARHDYEPTAKFKTYLQRILTRSCIDRVRKQEPVYSDKLPGGTEEKQDPLNDLVDEEIGKTIQETLEELSPRERMALILKYYHEMTYDTIADRMDCTQKAVESLLGRARKSFQSEIPDWVPDQVLSSNQSRQEAKP